MAAHYRFILWERENALRLASSTVPGVGVSISRYSDTLLPLFLFPPADLAAVLQGTGVLVRIRSKMILHHKKNAPKPMSPVGEESRAL